MDEFGVLLNFLHFSFLNSIDILMCGVIMIPDFNKEIKNDKGYWNLPPGVHKARWDVFCQHFGFNRVRRRLLRYMLTMLENLRDAGCRFVKIDGGFVTSSPEPEDFDGTWDPEGVDKTKLDQCIRYTNQNIMSKKYKGELFPQNMREDGTQGVVKSFDDFFQMDRDFNVKGIVQIDLETLP